MKYRTETHGRQAKPSLSSWRAWIEIEADAKNLLRLMSLSSWRAWIEMHCRARFGMWCLGRSPHGERGLKFDRILSATGGRKSLSSWRAWIEMQALSNTFATNAGRSPHGERGLKYGAHRADLVRLDGRSPHGERGLKYDSTHAIQAGSGRSPHGERGLKFAVCGGLRGLRFVALLMESVD